MRFSLPILALFCLACAGALNSMTPVLPVDLPANAATTGINVATQNGENTTEVSFHVPATNGTESLRTEFEKELASEGWTVRSAFGDDGPDVIDGDKGDETLRIELSESGDGVDVDVHWVH